MPVTHTHVLAWREVQWGGKEGTRFKFRFAIRYLCHFFCLQEENSDVQTVFKKSSHNWVFLLLFFLTLKYALSRKMAWRENMFLWQGINRWTETSHQSLWKIHAYTCLWMPADDRLCRSFPACCSRGYGQCVWNTHFFTKTKRNLQYYFKRMNFNELVKFYNKHLNGSMHVLDKFRGPPKIV